MSEVQASRLAQRRQEDLRSLATHKAYSAEEAMITITNLVAQRHQLHGASEETASRLKDLLDSIGYVCNKSGFSVYADVV